MSKKLRIVAAQLNLLVGDIAGNCQKHIKAAIEARDRLKADIIVFPELSLTGYPSEDLFLRKSFVAAANQALKTIQQQVENIHCLIGFPQASAQGLFNACALIYNGKILATYAKQHLPNYGVFDEDRYFIPGTSNNIVSIHGIPVGITICEDLWFKEPTQQVASLGARIILSPNASPFEVGKQEKREKILAERTKECRIPIIYVNNVGGQDDLVFDGGSMAIDSNGKICTQAGFFQEALLPIDVDITNTETQIQTSDFVLPTDIEKIYQALVLGVRDYVQKNRFPGAMLGLSGGIDSALTLCIAVDALGKDNVHAVMMPSRYTAEMSIEDAEQIASNLAVQYETISIEPVFEVFLSSLGSYINKNKPGITQENLQSRCRGVMLMALSNQNGKIVLTTGNRSELAVGYATLYGDMAGGFAVIKDVPKTLVYQLARYRNSIQAVIPERIITRAPTAELAYDQKDQDLLPPYDILDQILECYLNRDESIEEIVARGLNRETVMQVVKLVIKNEYKRRQAPIGTRINHTAFGRDRRYPVTSGE